MSECVDQQLTNELIRAAQVSDPNADDNAYWEPIRVLQCRLPHILDHLTSLGSEPSVKARDVAATVLGQNMIEEKIAVSECTAILLAMLRAESSPQVMSSIAFALGHLRDSRAVPALIKLKTHPDAQVRYAVVSGLLTHEEPDVIRAMIDLASDPDPDVRNWATFGLGSQIDADSPELREALLLRLSEAEDEVRGEAIVGLVNRGDVRVAPYLTAELASGSLESVRAWSLMWEAAEALASRAQTEPDRAWLPALAAFRTSKVGDQDALKAAVKACRCLEKVEETLL